MEHIEVVDVHDTDAASKLYDELTVRGIVPISTHMAYARRYSLSHQDIHPDDDQYDLVTQDSVPQPHKRNGLVTEL